MKIETVEQIEGLREIIGDQNAEANKRALADGAKLWVVRSLEELEKQSELTEKEKEYCRTTLKELGWAGIVRSRPKLREIPGLVPVPGYDAHGNYRGGSGGGHGGWSH